MKLVQFIGSSQKSDFVIYLAHMISKMGHRTLVVDTTLNQEYVYSYIRREEKEVLYDLQNIEIISNVRTFKGLESQLKSAKERVENYDYILVDSSDNCTFTEWPNFENTYYIGNDTRYNVMKDVEILNEYMDFTNKTKLNRIHFYSAFQIPEGYIEMLLNGRLELSSIYEAIDYDEKHAYLCQFIQHEHEIPYTRLSKSYKNTLRSVVTDICEVGNVDVDVAVNKSFFNRFRKQNLVPNKIKQEKATKPMQLKELKGVE